MHYGEGAYAETEREIQELLGVERDPPHRCARRTSPGCCCPPRPRTSRAPTRGPYEAGGVWAVLSGAARHGERAPIEVAHPGCHALVEHDHHTAGVLELAVGAGLECHMTCFTPGVPASRCPAPPAA